MNLICRLSDEVMRMMKRKAKLMQKINDERQIEHSDFKCLDNGDK